MTDIEQRLREELKAAASGAQPYMLRELTLPPRRRGARTPRWLAPAAAVIAVIAVIAGAQAVFRPGPSAPGPATIAAMPRFYVSVLRGGTLIVARSATGTVISRIVVPGAVIDAVTGTPDDRTFALAAISGSGAGEVTRFYAFQLAADGRPGGLITLPLSVGAGSAGYGVTGIALSPDARRLAVAVVPQSLQTTRPTPAHRARIEIVTLGTGEVRSWVAGAEVNLSDLSWAGGGRRLGYLSHDLRGVPRLPGSTRLNLLDTGRPGPDLAASSHSITPRTGSVPLDSALITAGGNTVIAWTGPVSGRSGEILAAYSARTGQRLRVLYRGPGHGNVVVQGDLQSADPSGRHVLISVLTVRGSYPVPGRLDNGRFTALPSPARSEEPLPAAW